MWLAPRGCARACVRGLITCLVMSRGDSSCLPGGARWRVGLALLIMAATTVAAPFPSDVETQPFGAFAGPYFAFERRSGRAASGQAYTAYAGSLRDAARFRYALLPDGCTVHHNVSDIAAAAVCLYATNGCGRVHAAAAPPRARGWWR